MSTTDIGKSRGLKHGNPARDTLLPDPDQRPDADIVIFDGHCRFCNRQVARLNRWDSLGRLAFLSLHDPRVRSRFPELTHEQLMQNMHVVDKEGQAYAGAASLRYLSRRLPRLYAIAPLLHVPGSLPVWQWLYHQVARRRYQLGTTTVCDDDACKIHFK